MVEMLCFLQMKAEIQAMVMQCDFIMVQLAYIVVQCVSVVVQSSYIMVQRAHAVVICCCSLLARMVEN